MDELEHLLKRIEERKTPKPYSSRSIDDILTYKWTCPHCGAKVLISSWMKYDENIINSLKLRFQCYTCGRQRYEKIPDIIEENGEAYIEE